MPDMSLPNIPILRRGQVYTSLDTVELKSVRTGETVALVNHANAGIIRRDLRRQSRDALRAIPSSQMLAISKEAGKRFMEGTLPLGEGQTQTPQEYIEQLSSTSGLPYSLVKRNMAKINQVFTEMETILKGLTRGLDLNVLDKGFGEQAGV